jgi:hypothetical protein
MIYIFLQSGGPVVADMKRADVLTYSDAECLKQNNSGPTEKHICAGGGGTGACGVSIHFR